MLELDRDRCRCGLPPFYQGGEAMSIYESISAMLMSGMLIIALLSFHQKKNQQKSKPPCSAIAGLVINY